jgi:hypothetical protein
MSIPLDRLYQYIEYVVRDITGSDPIIYGFYPHGSKKIEDLAVLQQSNSDWAHNKISVHIYSHDQEPLNYNYYQDFRAETKITNSVLLNLCINNNTTFNYNIGWYSLFNVYDKFILLHSEQNSTEVIKYQNDRFIPVYFWSHAFIARDWFRGAQYIYKNNDSSKTFLIYNRAWAGTREYRLKLIDLLIDQEIVSECKTTINPVDPELQIPYCNYQFANPIWKPKNCLEDFLPPTRASSCSSADFDIDDYCNTDIEVVLETLFDDQRIQLTEKILRPIACKQPFILVSTAGSLQYLQNYGFKTFNGIIDERYDTITDSEQRLHAIVAEMKRISNWSKEEKTKNINKMNEIAQYNHQHFFSDNFFNLITSELRTNLTVGLESLENTNTGLRYIDIRKLLAKLPNGKDVLIYGTGRTRKEIIKVLTVARKYYNCYLKATKK